MSNWDSNVKNVLDEVYRERQKQHDKWGEQNHPDGTGPNTAPLGPVHYLVDSRSDFATRLSIAFTAATDSNAKAGYLTWNDILLEEVFEALAENDPEKLRLELIQTAAVAVAWVEKVDRERYGS